MNLRKRILKLKAFMLVIIIFGIPLLLFIAIRFLKNQNFDLEIIVQSAVSLLFLILYLSWLLMTGINVNDKIIQEKKPNIKLFKFSILFSIFFFTLFILLWIFEKKLSVDFLNFYQYSIFLFVMTVILIMYSLYFVSKSFVILENSNFKRNLSEIFFILMIAPFGILVLHPVVQKLYEDQL